METLNNLPNNKIKIWLNYKTNKKFHSFKYITKPVQKQGICRGQKSRNNKNLGGKWAPKYLRVSTKPLPSTLMASRCDVTCRESPGPSMVKQKGLLSQSIES